MSIPRRKTTRNPYHPDQIFNNGGNTNMDEETINKINKILAQSEYMLLLAKKINEAAIQNKKDPYDTKGLRSTGSINNLAPELSKASSRIKKMLTWGYFND